MKWLKDSVTIFIILTNLISYYSAKPKLLAKFRYEVKLSLTVVIADWQHCY